MKWQPIETAPRSVEEIASLYPSGVEQTVLIGRASESCLDGVGVISGAVAECTLTDGKWCYPLPPDLRRMMGREYGELVKPTHWMPLPAAPTQEGK